jgi:shikimate kinase
MTMNDPLSAGRLYLIGLRGSGKTTVGRLLADRLGWAFADADEEIETLATQSIAELFDAVGLEGFRDRETELLRELALRQNHVIATGGGCIVRVENRELLRATGTTIWLTGEPHSLWPRVQRDSQSATRRPSLTNLSALEEIERLSQEREPLYREVADLTVATDGRSPDEVVSAIVNACS